MNINVDKEKADLASARAAHKITGENVTKAITALTDAVLTQSGFKGCIAEFTETHGWSRSKPQTRKTFRIRVEGTGEYGYYDRLRGRCVLSDGSLGALFKEHPIATAKNLGPWVDPKKAD